MKRVMTILAALALAAALPALLSVSAALSQTGGADSLAEYAGVLLTILVSALGCAACLLALALPARPRRPGVTGVTLLAGVSSPLIIAALFGVGLSGFAPLVALFNLLDPTLLWAVILTLALTAPLLALTTAHGWRLALVARPAAR